MRRRHGPDRHERPLCEQRQARDADTEGETDRGAREVEATCQVGDARFADEERRERCEAERDGDECRERPPGVAYVANRVADRAARRHSAGSGVERCPPGQQREPDRERQNVATCGRTAPVRRCDRRLDEAEDHAGDECPARLEPHDDRCQEAVETETCGRVHVERARGRSENRREAGPGSGQGEREAHEAGHRQPDEDRGIEVLGDRLEGAAEPRALQHHRTERGERNGDARHHERALLDRGTCDVPDPERQWIREDIGGTVEEDEQERPHREGDRERSTDPADHRAARPVRLDREEVRPGARRRRHHEPDDQRQQKSAAADARLRDRSGTCRHEQRDEDAERDQLPESEVDDAGQAEDDRLSGRHQAIDGACGKSAGEDLERDGHDVAL